MKKLLLVMTVLVLSALLLTGCGGAKVSELEAQVTTLESNIANKTNEAANLQSQLNEKDQQITNLNDTLATKDSQITDLNSQVKTKDTEISDLNKNLTASNSRITELNTRIETLETQATELESQIPQLKEPTYEEALAFIVKDNTNKEVPNEHVLACMLVVENAAKQGIRAYWVIALLGTSSYNFVGFNTADKGWIYFCNSWSCGDEEVFLEVSEKLYDLNPQWGTPTFDDTIDSLHYIPIP